MGRLRDAEVRRLLRHLSQSIEDAERLAGIEDELRGEYAEELLREPDLLAYFPELSDEMTAGDVLWRLRVIPHAHLRMVQRGFNLKAILSLFSRFVEACAARGQLIAPGPYTIFGRPTARTALTTLRIDVDTVTDVSGQAHVVTVFIGRSETGETIEVGPV